MKFQNLIKSGFFLLMVAAVMPAYSQVSNDNEDEVNKIDQRMAKWNSFVPGQVLVKFKDASPVTVRKAKGKFLSASRSSVDAVLQSFGVEDMEKLLPNEKPGRKMRKAKAFNGTTIVEKDLSQLYLVKLSKEKVMQTRELVDELGKLSEVEFAEPNYKAYIMGEPICSNPSANPLYSQQWGIGNMAIDQLWTKLIVNDERPVIAIIDTGVDITHPDLVDNIWTNQREAEGEDGYDNDNNGFKNDVHGWDFINNTGNIRDYNSHGTHVAGIAAAADNGIGIVGANPRALIMPVSVMQSDGSGDIATIIKGINYAVQNGATVLNMSLGTYTNSKALRQALEQAYQSAVLVAAAGNDGLGIYPECGLLIYKPCFPAAYSFVLGVQASEQSGTLASFSNFDCDGPNFSAEKDTYGDDGYNYEMTAPGVGILSSVPNGNYKKFNGTSMAAPLVAGGISALQMVKDYPNQEVLWGDLLHSTSLIGAYNITERPAELTVLGMQFKDRKELTGDGEADYSNDGQIDAGETVSIYPVLRTVFGEAKNIKMHLEMGDEYEDPTIVSFSDEETDFGMNLSPYGKSVSLNPLTVTISNDVANNRHIKLKLVATCDGALNTIEQPFTITVNNMVKIGGMVMEDMTLTADHEWLVSSNLAVPKGVTLTIEPGTVIKVADGMSISSEGNLKAIGEMGKMIHFTTAGSGTWKGLFTGSVPWGGTGAYDDNGNIISDGYRFPKDTLKYCIVDNFIPHTEYWPAFDNCIVTTNVASTTGGWARIITFRSNLVNCAYLPEFTNDMDYTNCVNSFVGNGVVWPIIHNLNYFNNRNYNGDYQLKANSSTPVIHRNTVPSYLGTSRVDIADNYAYDIDYGNGFAQIDLSNMLNEPVSEAHGIVWKVVVNGFDAQDEYEDLAPLGVGKHKFEVYFNRPTNKEKIPQISFGVREPYTQHVVDEDGSWNEEGTIYTAYKTITGRTNSDGVNRIYVYGAEDNEYFEIPYEKTRFNINIQAAGSMATGFAAEAGMGKVNLTWNNEDNNFEDAMGFNIYRYNYVEKDSLDSRGRPTGVKIIVPDTICINKEIVDVETTEYTDYDVTPGTTYYYMYKVLSTDLKEFDASNVVAVTPLTSTKGDANGSGDVDVADVITTVNYAAGQEPKPFIFEAADMNTDQAIDILDVIGIIKVIMNPGYVTGASVEATATYTVEDGIVYVDCPVALAGVQVQLATNDKQEITVADNLKGFEHTSAWLSDNDYIFLGYNMNGKTLAAGKNAILNIGNAKIGSVKLSDKYGHNIQALSDTPTAIDRMGSDAMSVKGIYTISGVKVSGNAADLKKLPKGVYIIDGEKVVK